MAWRHSPTRPYIWAARKDKDQSGKRATQGSIALTEKQEVKPILQINACSLSLDIVSLFDLKLKCRPCGSTSWFISPLSDRPFRDFLALLCSKIGPFGCPHAVLRPHWANTATVQTSFARQWAEGESCSPSHTILPLSGVVTSILPMSHQGASGPGYVQTIVSSEVGAYRGEWGFLKSWMRVWTEPVEIPVLTKQDVFSPT